MRKEEGKRGNTIRQHRARTTRTKAGKVGKDAKQPNPMTNLKRERGEGGVTVEFLFWVENVEREDTGEPRGTLSYKKRE